jgi:hypothetical protein
MELEIQPTFLLDALAAEAPVRKAIAKLIRTAGRLTEQQLRDHKGIHLHRIQNQWDPASGLPLEALEATRSVRVKAVVLKGRLALVSLHSDHDEAYGRK